ncbi:MAG: hypothetical protein GF398_15260 [Chitinivibrionales bacterium]|nr:hypothetical protein [Chitinivibrionales bacterium]
MYRLSGAMLLLCVTILAGAAFQGEKGSTYLKLGVSQSFVPFGWDQNGNTFDFTEMSTGLGYYGQRYITRRITTIVSGSLLSYAEAEYDFGMPFTRVARNYFAGPWSISAMVNVIQWQSNAIAAGAGVSWMFSSMPGKTSPHATLSVEYGRKFDPIRTELWSTGTVRISAADETRPRGKLKAGVKYHQRNWKWEIKAAAEYTAVLQRSGPFADQIVSVEERRISADSSYVVLNIEEGKPLSDSFAATWAGTWYVGRGFGLEAGYRHIFLGTNASAARTISGGVSYAW